MISTGFIGCHFKNFSKSVINSVKNKIPFIVFIVL